VDCAATLHAWLTKCVQFIPPQVQEPVPGTEFTDHPSFGMSSRIKSSEDVVNGFADYLAVSNQYGSHWPLAGGHSGARKMEESIDDNIHFSQSIKIMKVYHKLAMVSPAILLLPTRIESTPDRGYNAVVGMHFLDGGR